MTTSLSRKRKQPSTPPEEDHFLPKTKKQCLERLQNLDQVLKCPICFGRLYAPLIFLCGEHMACYPCVVQMLLVNQPIEQKVRSVFERLETNPVKCPCCNSRDTQFHHLSELNVLPRIVVNALYPETLRYACRYCAFSASTMSELSRHLFLCTHVSGTCQFCSQTYRLSERKRHLEQQCQHLPCFHKKRCSWTGSFEKLKQHYKTHDDIQELADEFSQAFYDLTDIDHHLTGDEDLRSLRTSVALLLRRLSEHAQRPAPASIVRVLLYSHPNQEPPTAPSSSSSTSSSSSSSTNPVPPSVIVVPPPPPLPLPGTGTGTRTG